MHMEQDLSTWFFRKRTKNSSNVKLRLFLFPAAGGDMSMYLNWERYLPGYVETCFVRLPGRGGRIGDEAISDMDEMIEQISEAIMEYIDIPYVVFGHSMGGLLVYELVSNLRKKELRLPEHMFISSVKPPHFMSIFSESFVDTQNESFHKLDDKTFKERIFMLGGIPEEIKDNDELLDYILPTFRSDLKLCETYRSEGIEKLPVSMDIYGGSTDDIAIKKELDEWKLYSSNSITITIFPGNHFYFANNPNVLLFNMAKKLDEIIRQEICVVNC